MKIAFRICVGLVFSTIGCTIQLSPNEARFDDLTRRVATIEATKADAARTAEAMNRLSAELEKMKPTPVPTPGKME